MTDLPRMTGKQFRRVKKLICRLCANYQDGNCLLLDDDEVSPCPQRLSRSLICHYFRNAVLPADLELYAEITMARDNRKQCVLCGKLFIPGSNRALYCGDCAQQERRRKCRERVRRSRSVL